MKGVLSRADIGRDAVRMGMWSRYRVTGVWKNDSSGCFAELDTRQIEDTISARNLRVNNIAVRVRDVPSVMPLARGDVLQGYFVPASQTEGWNGPRLFDMVDHAPDMSEEQTVTAVKRRFGFSEEEAERLADDLGSNCLFQMLSGRTTDMAYYRRLFGDARGHEMHGIVHDYSYKELFFRDFPSLSVKQVHTLLDYAAKDRLSPSEVHHWLKTDPYHLVNVVSGFGLMSADAVYFDNGGVKDDIERIDNLIRFSLRHVLSETGATRFDVSDNAWYHAWMCEFVRLSSHNATKPEWALSQKEFSGNLVGIETSDRFPDIWFKRTADGRCLVSRRSLAIQEEHVARELTRLAAGTTLYGDGWEDADYRREIMRRVESAFADRHAGSEPDPNQCLAVMQALRNRVSVITGGPGRGKTDVAGVICDMWLFADIGRVLLTSYTGKATARLAQMAADDERVDVRTMLSLAATVSHMKDDSLRKVCKKNGDLLVIVDEASMVDIPTMSQFLTALSNFACAYQLVIIGDENQLPSIGCGAMLHDVIASDIVPVARLTTCFRGGSGSTIVRNGDAIVDGRVGDIEENDAFSWRSESRSADEVFSAIVEEYVRLVTPNDATDTAVCEPSDVCLLSPFRTEKDPYSVGKLNKEIQALVNGKGDVIPGTDRWKTPLRDGDRVMFTTNAVEFNLVNGDTGTIHAAGRGYFTISCDDDRKGDVIVPNEELPNVTLAYAMTVHKSQGSEYDYVLIASSGRLGSPYLSHFATRNLMYTAVTRAKRQVMLFGSRRGFERSLGNVAEERSTGLVEHMLADVEVWKNE